MHLSGGVPRPRGEDICRSLSARDSRELASGTVSSSISPTELKPPWSSWPHSVLEGGCWGWLSNDVRVRQKADCSRLGSDRRRESGGCEGANSRLTPRMRGKRGQQGTAAVCRRLSASSLRVLGEPLHEASLSELPVALAVCSPIPGPGQPVTG